MENQNATQITVSAGKVTVDNVKEALANTKGEITKHRAQLRQIYTKVYPGGRGHDSLTDPLFSLEEFGFAEGSKYAESRISWIDVPKGTTTQQVEERLAKLADATLVRHLALNPILSKEQASAIQAGLTTIEDIGANQVVRDEDENIVAYKGYLQYRVIKFATEKRADIDTREKDFATFSEAGVPKPFQMAAPISVIAKTQGQAATANIQK